MNTKLVGVCALVAFAAGCATRQPARSEMTVAGITTVEQELGRAQEQLDATISVLGTLVGSPASTFADAHGKYVSSLTLLDERVYILRDRATLMEIRRDEYLRFWLEQTSQIQDPELRRQAEERKTRLMAAYLDLTARGGALKKSYASLHASLHDCERFLAADPQGVRAKDLAPELQKLRQGEKEVDAAAKAYRDGLNVIVDKLSVSASSLPPGK